MKRFNKIFTTGIVNYACLVNINIIAILSAGIVLFYSLLRGFRPPVSYAKAQWLISYDFGFIKRGLVGSLVKPIIQNKTPSEIELIIYTFSVLLLALFFATVLWVMYFFVKKQSLFVNKLTVFLFSLVFASSAYVVLQFNLVGFFDYATAICAILAVYYTVKKQFIKVSLLSILALAIHELYFLAGFPAVCWAVLLVNEKYWKSSRPLFKQRLLVSILTILIPVSFLGYIIWTHYDIPEKTIAELNTQIASYKLLTKKGVSFGTFHLKHNLKDNYNLQKKEWFKARLFTTNINKTVYPTVILFVIFIGSVLWKQKMLCSLAFAPIAVFSPLLLHLVAWDTARFTNLLILNSFLMVFSTLLLFNLSEDKKVTRFVRYVLWIASTFIFLINLYTEVPMMSGPSDRDGLLGIRDVVTLKDSPQDQIQSRKIVERQLEIPIQRESK